MATVTAKTEKTAITATIITIITATTKQVNNDRDLYSKGAGPRYFKKFC